MSASANALFRQPKEEEIDKRASLVEGGSPILSCLCCSIPGLEQFFEPTYVAYSYEFYFDHPVSVIDTFLIGVRIPYMDTLCLVYADYWGWQEMVSTTVYPTAEYQNYKLPETPLDKVNFCTDHLRGPLLITPKG